MTYEEFLEDAMQYHAGKSQTQKSTSMWQKILSFLNTYKWFFVGGIIIIGTGTLIIILKRRNSIKKRGI